MSGETQALNRWADDEFPRFRPLYARFGRGDGDPWRKIAVAIGDARLAGGERAVCLDFVAGADYPVRFRFVDRHFPEDSACTVETWEGWARGETE